MRRSLATWVLVAAAAALICLPSGCIGSRMGRKPAGDKWSMFSWGKKKPSTELAQNKPTPPSSNIAPGTNLASAPANNSSQPFPSQPASGSGGVPASYASTGASAYGPASSQGGYDSPSGQDNYVATSGGAAPQRGFYGDEYQGGGETAARSQYGQVPSGGYEATASGSQGGGYESTYGGSQSNQGYEQVADQRSSYGNQNQGGDSRYVSPQGQDQYDARNPAPAQYNEGYNNEYQGTSAGSSYGGSSQYSGQYNDTSSQGSYGNTGGAPVQSTSGARPWYPGSTKPYNQQPLNPPTNSGYGQY